MHTESFINFLALWIGVLNSYLLQNAINFFCQINLAERGQVRILVEVECKFVKTFIVQSTLLKTSGAAEVSWPGAILAILSFYDP